MQNGNLSCMIPVRKKVRGSHMTHIWRDWIPSFEDNLIREISTRTILFSSLMKPASFYSSTQARTVTLSISGGPCLIFLATNPSSVPCPCSQIQPRKYRISHPHRRTTDRLERRSFQTAYFLLSTSFLLLISGSQRKARKLCPT